MLLIAIAAGRASRSWERVLLIILEVLVEGGVLVSLFGEVWFLAKTLMTVGLPAASALVLAIVAGLLLVVPAVWSVWQVVAGLYTLAGRQAQFRSDFRGSLWLARSYTFRPRDF
jgi:hypothetical protein